MWVREPVEVVSRTRGIEKTVEDAEAEKTGGLHGI